MENLTKDLIDFASNDYLGFTKSKTIFDKTPQYLVINSTKEAQLELEKHILKFHQVESTSIFNSVK